MGRILRSVGTRRGKRGAASTTLHSMRPLPHRQRQAPVRCQRKRRRRLQPLHAGLPRRRIASRWPTKSQASTRARGLTMLGRSTTRRSTPRRRNRLGPAEALVLEAAAFGRNRCRWRTRPLLWGGLSPSMRLAQPGAKRRGAEICYRQRAVERRRHEPMRPRPCGNPSR